MEKHIHNIRKLVERIESGQQNFSNLYLYLDKMQNSIHSSSDSDSESNQSMNQYIVPIRNMLNHYKKGITRIKQNNALIEGVIGNQKENTDQNTRLNTKRQTPNRSTIKQLDQQIDQIKTQLIKKTLR